MLYIILSIIGILIVFSLLISMLFRTVVPTNEVHTLQKSKKTLSYGKDLPNGNVYYNFPSWVPFVGVERIILPVSIFPIDLENYEAYDSDKVPFLVDIAAFFRIEESNKAAQRISSFEELEEQLKNILQGVIRRVLAAKNIYEILEGRDEFSNLFTNEVNEQLKEWGVTTTKNVELMNIEDVPGKEVISNIQDMKTSEIETTSRKIVAENNKQAKVKEIEAKKEADIKQQEADKAVGEKIAEKDRLVGLAQEKTYQEIAEQKKLTMEKNKAVELVEKEKQAEIEKAVQIVKAREEKQANIIKAEGIKQAEIIKAVGERNQTILIAEGSLTEKQKEAEGIKAIGLAEAEAEKAMQMAPVQAKIALAEKIAELPEYIEYLEVMKGLEVGEAVGKAKAKALETGDLKVIANTGTPNDGVNNIMDLFSSKGGSSIASMLENLGQTETGTALLNKIIGKLDNSKQTNNKINKKEELKKIKNKNEIKDNIKNTSIKNKD